MNDSLANLITRLRVETLQARGVLIFDVDDTLLARRGGSTANGEKFADSAAAMMLPDIVRAGIRVALMTGHGWAQLEERLVHPLLLQMSKGSTQSGESFFVYANRGATRIIFKGGECQVDEQYAKAFRFPPDELKTLTAILGQLAGTLRCYTDDLKIECREGTILSLRTLGARIPKWEYVRHELIGAGKQSLKEKGLESRFQIAAAGKNSIEIASDNAEKSFACSDLFQRVGNTEDCTADQVRTSSLYIGDEFEDGGNDKEVAMAYPDLKCISVGQKLGVHTNRNIIQMELGGVSWGPDTTWTIISSILKVLD